MDAPLKTEDTGKTLEMAICLAYNTKFKGKFKYSMDDASCLAEKIAILPTLFPSAVHTAENGSRYDFTNETGHLSAKTVKKSGGKVAPQVIGQPSPKKFCDIIGIDYVDVPTLKHYIQDNPAMILKLMCDYTFDCPNVFYVKNPESIRWIELKKQIDWQQLTYIWTKSADEWKNSTTLKMNHLGKFVSLAEFQFHTKSRQNLAIRWNYENFITIFSDHLNVIKIF